MKKMPPLYLEVIRFETGDVIISSGTGSPASSSFSPLSEGTTYFAFGSEINDYTGTKDRKENYVSTFYFDQSTGAFTIRNGEVCKISAVGGQRYFDYPYAWYNDIAWVTENKSKEYYLEVGWTQ